ncbi:MAG: hypothetical protein JXA43_01460 [Candidatus Diapherotrites archaeon]|nr:hypothetical protein [Candidatus Diapherotrites archaeon]
MGRKIDLADTLNSIDVFLNVPADEIIQVQEGYLTKEQLEEGREIVRNKPKLMEFYKNFEKYSDGCQECLMRILCCEIFDVVSAGDLYYCEESMFIPERIFENVKGFENIPHKFSPEYFDED